MLVNEVLLEADKEYDLTVPTKYLEKGPDKGMFKKGRKGKIKHAVQQIQFFLSAKGYKYRVKNKSGKVITGLPKPDGWYGAKTASAVRAFKKDKGLKPDGDVGKNTLLAMIQTDTPDLTDKPDSAELTSKEYPKDYVEQQYKKLKKDPDSAKQLFATKPDMTDALKATLQGILKAARADKGDDVKIFNLPMIVNMTNIDMVLKNTDEKIIKPGFRPIWIDQLIKGLKDAAVHARISPEYIKKVIPVVQKLNKIDKDKKVVKDPKPRTDSKKDIDLTMKDVEKAARSKPKTTSTSSMQQVGDILASPLEIQLAKKMLPDVPGFPTTDEEIARDIKGFRRRYGPNWAEKSLQRQKINKELKIGRFKQ